MNSWKNKWHDTCKARYTLTFGDKIKEHIVQNEEKSKTDLKKRYKLVTFEHPDLFDPLNYAVMSKKCTPSLQCPRHGHISFCSETGPKPNPKAIMTKNGPTRISQRVFRQNFKDKIYLNPKKDFMIRLSALVKF